VGRPNAGKSTLLNQLLGNKLAITSPKPQTTRNRIAGVYTAPDFQCVLVDTPGIHKPFTELNKQMVDRALSSVGEVDVVCWIHDLAELASRLERGLPLLDETSTEIAQALEKSGRPIVFVPNKVDLVPATLALPVIDQMKDQPGVVACVPASALTGDNVERLLAVVREHLPEGPALFPPDQWTQVTERFLAAEVIREQVFLQTDQEVPYATFVEVVTFDESERETRNLTRLYAELVVERDTQKGILIGKGGEMLKRIGTAARLELQRVLDCRVHLELRVKVERDWTRSARGLRRVGFQA
jgi:GTP-binding protein Era